MYIHSATFWTNDLAATAHFYTQVLALEQLTASANAVSFRVGTSILTFEYNNSPQPFYHFAFNIASSHLLVALEWAQQHLDLLPTGEIESPLVHFESWDAKAFYFYDNNGNIVELIARAAIIPPLDLPPYFDVRAILSISEVGIVVPDVPAVAQVIGVPRFARQTPRTDFTALGDDNGLIILAKEGRIWFPTTTPAKRFGGYVETDQGRWDFYI